MRAERGFTMLEILAALAIAGLATLGAVLLLDQLQDDAARIVSDADAQSANANGARLIRRLLEAAVADDSMSEFRGDEHSVELRTRCDVPSGWSEWCRVRLSVDQRRDTAAVIAQLPAASYTVVRTTAGAELRYLNSSVAESAWVRQWSSRVALPAAIGLVARSDTVVFTVGGARD